MVHNIGRWLSSLHNKNLSSNQSVSSKISRKAKYIDCLRWIRYKAHVSHIEYVCTLQLTLRHLTGSSQVTHLRAFPSNMHDITVGPKLESGFSGVSIFPSCLDNSYENEFGMKSVRRNLLLKDRGMPFGPSAGLPYPTEEICTTYNKHYITVSL